VNPTSLQTPEPSFPSWGRKSLSTSKERPRIHRYLDFPSFCGAFFGTVNPDNPFC
jgi:hypothetical protein